MIELVINSSKDKDISGPYLSFADKIVIGKNSQADLIISDDNLAAEHLSLEIIGSQLRLTPLENAVFWHNGKKSVSARNAKVGDTIKVGESTLKLMSFVTSPWNAASTKTLEEKFLSVSNNDPVRKIVLEALKRELQQLENEAGNVSKNSR